MADPQIVYIVAAVVTLGLAAWVLVVLLRPNPGMRATRDPNGPSTAALGRASSPAPPDNTRRSERPKLDSHAEIRDDTSAEVARDLAARDERTGR
ncbi:MAG: hypothetical protein M3O50_10295 [Myxococcota bacterium]|nr:hypothetical protein [Myxococcota bacterium]